MEALGILILVLLLLLYNVFAWGYVASVFYGWFVLPYFPNLPHFGYVEFIGFVLFFGVLTHKSPTFIKDEYKDLDLQVSKIIHSLKLPVTLYLNSKIKKEEERKKNVKKKW